MNQLPDIKKIARKDMSKDFKKVFLISLLFSLAISILGLINYFSRFANSAIYIITSILVIVMMMPLTFGFFAVFFKFKNKEKISYLDGFKLSILNFSRTWTIIGNIMLKMIVLFILILSFILILAINLSVLNSSNLITSHTQSPALLSNPSFILSIIGLIGYTVCLVLLVPKSFLYILSFLIGFEYPKMKAKKVVETSAKLMKGYRWKLFCILISFFFWLILAFVPYSIFRDAFNLPIIGLILFLICYSILVAYVMFTLIEFYKYRTERIEKQ